MTVRESSFGVVLEPDDLCFVIEEHGHYKGTITAISDDEKIVTVRLEDGSSVEVDPEYITLSFHLLTLNERRKEVGAPPS